MPLLGSSNEGFLKLIRGCPFIDWITWLGCIPNLIQSREETGHGYFFCLFLKVKSMLAQLAWPCFLHEKNDPNTDYAGWGKWNDLGRRYFPTTNKRFKLLDYELSDREQTTSDGWDWVFLTQEFETLLGFLLLFWRLINWIMLQFCCRSTQLNLVFAIECQLKTYCDRWFWLWEGHTAWNLGLKFGLIFGWLFRVVRRFPSDAQEWHKLRRNSDNFLKDLLISPSWQSSSPPLFSKCYILIALFGLFSYLWGSELQSDQR